MVNSLWRSKKQNKESADMPTENPGRHRKHTPITSKAQKGLFGAELARRRAGKRRMASITTKELRTHLKETKGKKLPKRA